MFTHVLKEAHRTLCDVGGNSDSRLACRRELRFPIITEKTRDSEIAPTGTLSHYFNVHNNVRI